jgi:hypothetical protein
MPIDFDTIEYLKEGNKKQQAAYLTLRKAQIFDILSAYNPILVGTIPIAIDIDSSDLDIVCCAKNLEQFRELILKHYSNTTNFKVYYKDNVEPKAVVAKFIFDEFEIEIFAQNKASHLQNAYRHMIVEHQLLNKHGEAFRKDIIKLKKKGYKTEPAFAKALDLKGNPYNALLKLQV